MNRAIKFRITIQHEETGNIAQMFYDYSEIFNGYAKKELEKQERWYVIGKSQFTGLLDKNGKEIYEGDIIKTRLGNLEVFFGKVTTIAFGGVVLSSPATFGLRAKDKEYLLNLTDYDEVIGNIYENPELLNKDK